MLPLSTTGSSLLLFASSYLAPCQIYFCGRLCAPWAEYLDEPKYPCCPPQTIKSDSCDLDLRVGMVLGWTSCLKFPCPWLICLYYVWTLVNPLESQSMVRTLLALIPPEIPSRQAPLPKTKTKLKQTKPSQHSPHLVPQKITHPSFLEEPGEGGPIPMQPPKLLVRTSVFLWISWSGKTSEHILLYLPLLWSSTSNQTFLSITKVFNGKRRSSPSLSLGLISFSQKRMEESTG